MGSRENLQTELEAVLGSRNVYFQPPENLKIEYPAIIYAMAKMNPVYANNKMYMNRKKYQITLIHDDPDNELKEQILEHFQYISFDRPFNSDNLYHYVYELFY